MASVQMQLDQPHSHDKGSTSSNNSLDNNNNNNNYNPTTVIANDFTCTTTNTNNNNNTSSTKSKQPHQNISRSLTPTCNSVAGHSKSDLNNNTTNHIQDNNANQSQYITPDMPMNRLKKMGWYWGSISPEYAAKLLEDEQDGSFLVRDSSSECYIFSMTFKLEGQIHHSRIEHCKGQFSFGRSPKFRCTTIVDFIEHAIAFSHNEELLFFLHRDPSMEGPVRFRMIPLSRLKGMTSLKHLCRFAILPYVRRDRISELSIPECLREYLYEPFYQTT